jgi:hypothetical protein
MIKHTATQKKWLAAAAALAAAATPVVAFDSAGVAHAGSCKEWAFDGQFNLKQSTGHRVTIPSLYGQSDDGQATVSPEIPGGSAGPVKGMITGRNVTLEIHWPSGVTGTYWGEADDNGFVKNGTTMDNHADPAKATWYSETNLKCIGGYATQKCEPAANYVTAEVEVGAQCVPKPPKKCPEGSVKAEVPPAEDCTPPTDAITMDIQRAGSNANVTVTNSAGLAGNCKYRAYQMTENPVYPEKNDEFPIAAKGSVPRTYPWAPPLTTWLAAVTCTGTYNGTEVQLGHAEKTVKGDFA